jgi:CheY-like chemotaxis protein
MQQAEQVGLQGFLIKPISPSMLFDATMQAFGVAVPETSGVAQSHEQEAEALKQIQGARVLLVEDNEINQQVAQEILESAGLNVTLANNGQEAVDAVKAYTYDAVLMDVQMPVMDGYEATRTIRKWESVSANADSDVWRAEGGRQKTDDRHQRKEGEKLGRWEGEKKSAIRNPQSAIKSLPIIAMTAHAMAGDEDKSLQAGMNGHVTKPIDPDQLFATLLKWIQPREEATADRHPDVTLQETDLTQQKQAEEELPESLPGFDLAAGLSRLMGNKRLYTKLLLDFGANYGGVVGEIRTALAAKDFEQAHSLVHNLKGLAGNLEAIDLQAAAVNMEKLVKGVDKQDPSSKQLNLKLSELENALMHALESVQSLGVSPEENACELSDGEIAALPAKFAQDIAKRIRDAAEMGDVMTLNAIAEEVKTQSDSCVPLSKQINQMAEDFDLDGIQKLADALEAG